MAETHWDAIRGKTLRYLDHTWELTGDVDVRDTGKVLAVDANQVDDVRRRGATLYFGLQNASESLNPGNLGEHFHRLERVEGEHHLVVRKDPRTYRYALHRMEYA